MFLINGIIFVFVQSYHQILRHTTRKLIKSMTSNLQMYIVKHVKLNLINLDIVIFNRFRCVV